MGYASGREEELPAEVCTIFIFARGCWGLGGVGDAELIATGIFIAPGLRGAYCR